MRSEFPKTVAIETVAGCNLSCIICPVSKMKKKGFMSDSLYLRVIEEVAEHEVQTLQLFMDGEPLLDKKLEERIQKARSLSINGIVIATNATLLTEERSQSLIDSGLSTLIISLDGMFSDTHKRIRGIESQIVVDNTLSFLKRNKSAVQVIIRILGFRSNSEERKSVFKKFWLDHGANHVTCTYPHNWGGSIDIKDFPKEKINRPPNCTYLDEMIIVKFDGRIPLCCVDYDCTYEIGNVVNDSIFNIWNGENLEQLRDFQKHGQITICTKCNWIPGSSIEI